MGIILVLTLLLIGFLTALFVFHKHSENELNHKSQILAEVAKCKLRNDNDARDANAHANENRTEKVCPVCPTFQNLDKVCPSDKYILKSKIKPSMSEKIKTAKYIRKCPKCPTCPKCPKCPESSNNNSISRKQRFFPDDLLGGRSNYTKNTDQVEKNKSNQTTELKQTTQSNQEINNIELEWIPVHNTKCRVD